SQTALAVVSAATFERDAALAAEMIASGFTSAIGPVSAAAAGSPLPFELAGFSIAVRDSAGAERTAGLIAVANGQVNFVLPSGVAAGAATITLRSGGRAVASGTARIAAVAPGLFTANASGRGAPAGLLLSVWPDGSRATQELFVAGSGGGFLPQPFDAAAEPESFLLLFGTGLRGFRSRVTATVGGQTVPVLAAVVQGTFAGLDQVNIGPLPRTLASRRGEVEVAIGADEALANPVTIAPAAPASGRWGRRAGLLDPNSEIAVAELNGKIYVIGGYPSSRVTVATVQAYDPAADRWERVTPLPRPLNHAMAASSGGKLYVIGGETASAGTTYVDSVYEYDPATAAWTARAAMPTARSSGSTGVIDGKIYVAGGRPPRGSDFAVYDPRADRWTTLPELPTQRNHLGVAALNGKLYVIGGRFGGGANSELTGVVEVFDPASNTWARRAPMIKPRGGINALEALGCLHVFGGENNPQHPSGVFPDHDVYNPVTDTWASLE
ncbi:MAG: kelch repeat-containing protein, partial [Dongiaceae bacterium]